MQTSKLKKSPFLNWTMKKTLHKSIIKSTPTGRVASELAKNVSTQRESMALKTNGDIAMDILGTVAQVLLVLQFVLYGIGLMIQSSNYRGPVLLAGVSCLSIAAVLAILRVTIVLHQRTNDLR